MKKAQQEHQEINEVLLHSIVTKKIPKDDNLDEEVSKRASKKFGPEKKKETIRRKEHLQPKTKLKQTEKENKWTTLKDNLKKLNQPPLMENPE